MTTLFTSLFLFLTSRSTHCIGYIKTGSFMGRGNQYIQLVKVLYCKLSTNSKQLPAFLLGVRLGFKLWSQRWEARVLPLLSLCPPPPPPEMWAECVAMTIGLNMQQFQQSPPPKKKNYIFQYTQICFMSSMLQFVFILQANTMQSLLSKQERRVRRCICEQKLCELEVSSVSNSWGNL